jgi:pimeloyl-ACP methyl ester carboxylesterase
MDNKLVLDDQLPQLSSKIEFNIDKNNNTEKYENNINNFEINKDDININAKFEQFLKEEDIIPEPIENMDFNKQNCFSERNLKKYPTVNSIIKHEKTINSYEVKIPKNKIRDRIIELETELFSLMNIEYGKEIIYEDFVLVSNNENYYVHLLRTENLDPNKENFLLIHGFLSSSTHFLSVLPFLLQKYNVFIPDTLGMGLSSRPQVEFNSPHHCENFFIEMIYILVKKIFFSGNYNIKSDFYIGGHSLGGFMVSHYILKYPKGIKKVLLLSAAGITDYHIKGTDIHKEAGKLFGCCLSFLGFCWACKPRLQCCYKWCCCKKLINSFMETYSVTLDKEFIKKNKDGTNFEIDINRINYVLGQLSRLTLDFPDDIYKCMYYIFTLPPPASVNPAELHLLYDSKLSCIFVYGENDWMDRTGAFRLCQQDRERFKLYIVGNSGHSFAMENPRELINILQTHF